MDRNASTSRLAIKPYSKKELAAIYQMSPRCFSTWLKPFDEKIGKKQGKFYNVKQVQIIIDALGIPYLIDT